MQMDRTALANSIRRWTPAERSALRRLAHIHGVEEIAIELTRSVTAVRSKAAHERIALLRGRQVSTG
jgi:hypothetical protein